jgi:glycosyltransferase involved in cell wall biosynthesis
MVTTAARRWCIPLAIRCFQRQTAVRGGKLDTELVIASEDDVEDLIPPDDPRVRFVRTSADLSLGEKHNEAVRRCRHDWLAKWDDDDWHAPRRLGLTLRRLRMAGALIAGTHELIFHELCDSRRTFLYRYQGARPWVAGTSLVFQRRVWEHVPFPDRPSGVDTVFAWRALDINPHVILNDPGIVVVFQHGQTTGRKTWAPAAPYYTPWSGRVEDLIGGDLVRYEAAFAGRPAGRDVVR